MINKFRTGLTALSDRLKIRRDPVGFARSLGVRIGHDCRLIGFQRFTFGSEPYLVTLGDHVTITGGVQFIPHDGGVWVFRDRCPDIELMGPITIGSNVFIGMNSIIMPGVTIGDNCIVGAGAVVTRDIPAGTVAVGVPARPIKTLDEYWNKIKDQAVHTRALAEPEKRRTLEEHFGLPVSG